MPTDNKNKSREPQPASSNKKEDVQEARRGLLRVMIDRFSSTPLQEEEYSTSDTIRLRHRLAEERNDLAHDASLTPSERNYLSLILQNGDTSSIQSASAKLQDEFLFPQQRHLEADDSGSVSSSKEGSQTTDGDEDDEAAGADDGKKPESQKSSHKQHKKAPRRNSLIQQQLFILHESEPEVHPSQLLQRMSDMQQRKNSILATDGDNSSTVSNDAFSERSASGHDRESTLLRIRSLSPPSVVEGDDDDHHNDDEARQQPSPIAFSGLSALLPNQRQQPRRWALW